MKKDDLYFDFKLVNKKYEKQFLFTGFFSNFIIHQIKRRYSCYLQIRHGSFVCFSEQSSIKII